MDRTIKLYSLQYSDVKTYLMALVFVAGNIILPQLCHLIPQGGLIFLPIFIRLASSITTAHATMPTFWREFTLR